MINHEKSTKPIRRNSIVTDERDVNGGHWTPYGRVVTVKSGLALVIFVTRDYDWIPVDKLQAYNYKGRWDRCLYKEYFTTPWSENFEREEFAYYVWRPMLTLRKLKQRSSHYYPEIWKESKK